MLRVMIDGKHFCSLTDAKVHTFQVKSGVDLEHKPYDIVIEYTKDGQVKKYGFQGSKMHDVVLKFYYDRNNMTQIL
ncbi:MAG: hypothetical protein K0R55_4087 [Sporomusa sp.]|nr:hypothetical protein [Sporomusa sp.]